MTRFIADVPTVWDETRALMGVNGDYVAVARRRGAEWWVGALTDEAPRTLALELSFLDGGAWTATAYRDGPNADRYAGDHVREVLTVEADRTLDVELASGGGWVARFEPDS